MDFAAPHPPPDIEVQFGGPAGPAGKNLPGGPERPRETAYNILKYQE